MNDLVLDTHVLVWHLTDSSRLTSSASLAIQSSVANGGRLYISTMSLIEILYLQEKGKIPLLPFDQITDQLFGAGTAFVEMPITASIVTAMRDLPRETVPDMPDRIIAATAKYLGVPLVTRDLRIRSLALATVW